ncbi:DNA/RNA non-specific endonuclease [Bacteroides sp. UBA939]|uniref:DNA/RNA non-specific endonuclease n=1 Tax=Bacteroides sp. UBA939 TaxID=1946092 RepID=UPI0025C473D7|nr:DNA/RNA non-specific endonuclease [Bacteroides sp. UBA939]
MYKRIILILISIFVLAIAIGQCTNDDEYVNDESLQNTFVDDNKSLANIEHSKEITDQNPSPKKELDLNEMPKGQPNAKIAVEHGVPKLETPRIINAMPEQILSRLGYSLSYNNTTKCANWVAWHLTKEHTDGPWSRKGTRYFEDTEASKPRQELVDWGQNPNGLDHGHMCPAGDNKWSKQAMEQTYLLTNICPQNRKLNGGDWKELEEKCRKWAKEYGDIYIACGPMYYNEKKSTIGGSKEIWVPDAFYKVVLCMKETPKAIGFIYPNEGRDHPMSYYACSVDNIESKTDIDFFYNLPDDIEVVVETQNNINGW